MRALARCAFTTSQPLPRSGWSTGASSVETEPAATEGEDQQDDKKHRSMSVDPTSEDDQGEPEDAGEAYGRSNAQKQGLSARHRSGRVRCQSRGRSLPRATL